MLAFILSLSAAVAAAQAYEITVSSTGGNATSKTPYGVMFEDINHAGDGGFYAELIQNRAFQGNSDHPPSLIAWSAVNGASLSLVQNASNPLSTAVPNYVNVAIGSNSSSGQIGLANSGWWGIDVEVQEYTGSFWVRGAYNGSFTASLQSSPAGQTFGSVVVDSRSTASAWKQHNFTLSPSTAAGNVNNTFSITFDSSAGSLDFAFISLFPPTYNDRPNGLRKDLMQALADNKPKFLRFPGGSNLEGNGPGGEWKWNQTIGPLIDRPGRSSIWGYFETTGLGLIEYLFWCQDLGMEPILAVWDGLYLSGTVLTQDELAPWVQTALDELEFLTGSTDTQYGALRASLGYPDPFTINYVEIGNEDNLDNGLDSYQSYRFSMFYDAITAAYPSITVMASCSEFVGFNTSGFPLAAADYHQYTTPDGFVSQFDYFDQTRTKTLIGEVATVYFNNPGNVVPWDNRTTEFPTYPFWIGSVGEAVFLIGAERNGDRVIGAAYAPTFANINSYQWSPDQIFFDADPADTTLSTSWYELNLLANNPLSTVLSTTASGNGSFGPLYWVAGSNDAGASVFKAAVYNSTSDVPVSVSFDGVSSGTSAMLTVLTADDPYASNVIGEPNVVQTNITTLTSSANGTFVFSLPNLSIAVLSTGTNSTSVVSGKAASKRRDLERVPRAPRRHLGDLMY